MRLILGFLLAVFLAAFGILVWNKREKWFPEKPQPDAVQYATLGQSLGEQRKALAARWRTATPEQKKTILRESRVLLEVALPKMMRCWLGTPWDFNGMAKEPGKGKIACGYFVATLLEDAGFRFNRVRMAQQPSEKIIRAFLPPGQVGISSDQPYPAFLSGLAQSGDGVYLVGLDTHVGFLVIRQQEWAFIHASASSPWCVVSEGHEDASALMKSRYRVTGNLTASKEALVKWLEGTPLSDRKSTRLNSSH